MKKLSFKSLRVILSLIVVIVIITLTAVLVVTSYNLAYSAIEESYSNQVTNFNNEIERNMVDFYEMEKANARYFAKNPFVIDAVRTGQYNEARPLLTHFFKERGHLRADLPFHGGVQFHDHGVRGRQGRRHPLG